PARETLAAAVALLGLAEQPSPDVVVDPFCGSGAVLIEVGDALAGLAPGRARSFAFERAGWFRPGRWREGRRRLGVDPAGGVEGDVDAPAAPTSAAPTPHLLGIDADARVLAAARANLDAAGHAGVKLHAADSLAFDLGSLGARHGLIVSNLPYGVRLGDAAKAAALTRRSLDRLGRGATRWRFALLTGDAGRGAGHPDVRGARVTARGSGGRAGHVATGWRGGCGAGVGAPVPRPTRARRVPLALRAAHGRRRPRGRPPRRARRPRDRDGERRAGRLRRDRQRRGLSRRRRRCSAAPADRQRRGRRA